MKIAVIGAGGVGGYFGARWAAAGLDVWMLARGDHLRAIRDDGLCVESPLGDVTVQLPASAEADDIGPVDLVMLATKTWQLESALEQIPPLLGPDTMVLTVQNGVEAPDQVGHTVGTHRVLGGTCRIISYISSPGTILHVGVQPSLVFGEPSGGMSQRVEDVLAALSRGAGMTLTASSDIQRDLWRKFLFFAATSGLGSISQAPIGGLRSVMPTRQLLEQAIQEVVDLGRARGVDLDIDSTAQSMAFIDTLPPEGTSSLQRDVAEGRRTELEALSGAVVRLGTETGVATPVHGMIYAALLPRELEARAT